MAYDQQPETKRSPEATAGQVQAQIQGGASPEAAVDAALGAEADPAGFVQQMYEQSGMEQAGGMMADAAQTASRNAQGMGARLMKAARGLAMEVSDALFGGRRKRDGDKI